MEQTGKKRGETSEDRTGFILHRQLNDSCHTNRCFQENIVTNSLQPQSRKIVQESPEAVWRQGENTTIGSRTEWHAILDVGTTFCIIKHLPIWISLTFELIVWSWEPQHLCLSGTELRSLWTFRLSEWSCSCDIEAHGSAVWQENRTRSIALTIKTIVALKWS